MSLIPHFIHELEKEQDIILPVRRNNDMGQKLDKPIKCCDKSFYYQRPYVAHLDCHVQCDICSFSACRRSLNEHIMKAHCNLVMLNTPEQIEQWREARRKNFPTKNKIIKKRQSKLDSLKEKAKQFRLEELSKRTNNDEIDMECSDDEQVTEIDAKYPVTVSIAQSLSISNVVEYKILQIIDFIANK